MKDSRHTIQYNQGSLHFNAGGTGPCGYRGYDCICAPATVAPYTPDQPSTAPSVSPPSQSPTTAPYVVLESGQTPGACEAAGYITITAAGVCQAAASTLGISSPFLNSPSLGDEPSGCIYGSEYDLVVLNSGSGPGLQAHCKSEWRCICAVTTTAPYTPGFPSASPYTAGTPSFAPMHCPLVNDWFFPLECTLVCVWPFVQ